MTKRRGLYKEYIQILPAAESGTMVPVVSVEGYVGLRALSPADAPEPPSDGTGDSAAEPAPAVEPPALTAPMVEFRLPPPSRATRPAAAPLRDRRRTPPSDGRIALIVAALALTLSTGALTWTIMSQPRANADIAALAASMADLRGRVAANDGEVRATDARIGQIEERLERTELAQSLAASRLAALDASLDSRIAATTQAALTHAMPSPTLVTASLSLRPSVEQPSPQPIRPVEPAPPKRPVATGWVLRDAADGTARVEGRRGTFEVAVGSPLPGLGRVVAIEKRDGRMVVVTPRGLIVPPEPD